MGFSLLTNPKISNHFSINIKLRSRFVMPNNNWACLYSNFKFTNSIYNGHCMDNIWHISYLGKKVTQALHNIRSWLIIIKKMSPCVGRLPNITHQWITYPDNPHPNNSYSDITRLNQHHSDITQGGYETFLSATLLHGKHGFFEAHTRISNYIHCFVQT